MKILPIMLTFMSIVTLAQRSSSENNTVSFRDVRSAYQTLNQVEPILVNQSADSIFLSRLWPYGSARVVRFNDETRQWESGEWPGGCGVVANPEVPIEIKPNDQITISVMWQWSMDDWDNPKYFVLQDHETKRPLAGKYKLVLRYALTPWTVGRHPKEAFVIESSAFTVDR